MSKPSLPCESCRKDVYAGDKFCESCGAEVSEARQLRLANWAHENAMDDARAVATRSANVRKASRMIVLLAALFCVTGLVAYVMQRDVAEKALRNIAAMNDADVFPQPIEGRTYTVRELREEIESAPRQVLVVNETLAVILFGLFAWSRKSALPAIVTAFGVVVAAWLISAVLDPKTLVQGILIKILAIGALVAGVKAALAERAAQREEAS